jgi:exonuclease VII small subunit
MSDRQFVDWVRTLEAHLRADGEFTDELVQELESQQDRLAKVFESYEAGEAPELAVVLRELMMEAIQLIHDGLEELLVFSEDPDEGLLSRGVAMVEEGNDILDSLRYAIEQDTSWTSDSALG